jgi:hypothetical protein
MQRLFAVDTLTGSVPSPAKRFTARKLQVEEHFIKKNRHM